jgi:hypothetical protein
MEIACMAVGDRWYGCWISVAWQLDIGCMAVGDRLYGRLGLIVCMAVGDRLYAR